MSTHNSYRRPMTGWYRKNPRFIRYMLRELTAVFLAAYALILLAGVIALSRGPESWAAFQGFLLSPFSVALHGLIFIAAVYHSCTWFAVSPKAMPPVVLGKKRLPDRIVTGAQFALFIMVSVALVLWAMGA